MIPSLHTLIRHVPRQDPQPLPVLGMDPGAKLHKPSFAHAAPGLALVPGVLIPYALGSFLLRHNFHQAVDVKTVYEYSVFTSTQKSPDMGGR